MPEKVIFVFFDTNIFLHFKFISEINWSEIFPDSKVNYVIASCIIRELDEHKYKGISKKQKSRAKQILERFYKILEQNERKLGNAKIEFISQEPPKMIFENNNLSESNKDDRLLAHIIEFRSQSSPIYLITDDLALIIKARNLDIEVKRLDEKYRLEDELDENEKIISQLRKENLELKERKPSLKLVFDNEKDFREYTLNSPKDFSNYINNELERFKDSYQSKTLEEENKRFPTSKLNDLSNTPISKLSFSSEYKKDEIDAYNRELHQFFSEYEKYLSKYISFLKFTETTLNLQIYLFNFGNISAKNIRVNIHFSDGFELLEKNKMMSEPKKPEPPKLRSPFAFLDMLTNRDLTIPNMISSLNVPSLASQINNPPNVSGVNIKKTHSYDVDLKVRDCPHKHKEKILSLILKFESFEEAKSFTINYRLIADDIPDFISGILNVKIVKPLNS